MSVETTTFIHLLYKHFGLFDVLENLNANARQGRMWAVVKPSSTHASDIFPWLHYSSTFPKHIIIIIILKLYKCIYREDEEINGAWKSINPLNAELNPICHLLILLGDLTFMGQCIASISNKMQR
jgi:hypothetical protein